MASPLLPYVNSRLLVIADGIPSVTDGRISSTPSAYYLVKAFMKRIQYSGVSSGSRKIPLESQLDGQMLPGASGDQFYYRGYSLLYATVPSTFVLGVSSESGLALTQVKTQPEWLLPGREVQFKIGQDPVMNARIQRSSGIFGGIGIDGIIYREIGGVELQLTGTELQN
jgi:hypothetical protein